MGRPDRGAFKVPGDDKVQLYLLYMYVYIHVSDAISMGTSCSNHSDLYMTLSSALHVCAYGNTLIRMKESRANRILLIRRAK